MLCPIIQFINKDVNSIVLSIESWGTLLVTGFPLDFTMLNPPPQALKKRRLSDPFKKTILRHCNKISTV